VKQSNTYNYDLAGGVLFYVSEMLFL